MDTQRRSKSPFRFDESSDESPENDIQTPEISPSPESESLSEPAGDDETLSARTTSASTEIAEGNGSTNPNPFPSPAREETAELPEELGSQEATTPPQATALLNQQQVAMEEVAAILGEDWYPQTPPPRKRRCYRRRACEVVDYARMSLKTAEDYEKYALRKRIPFCHDNDHLGYHHMPMPMPMAGVGMETVEDTEIEWEHVEDRDGDGDGGTLREGEYEDYLMLGAY
ncbi:hypothetical protein C8A03DRAFT_34426 [Achaetomium macrosporum]|uniref:Uncharacterized protein n=1 Tax=Achaetomium macrosporum TaxID=79813 RepID=A0AAN7CAW5_9PEZI|nr:hypothetical protein C8A03DRAFT_34426 [Achaetomium macrosporum]